MAIVQQNPATNDIAKLITNVNKAYIGQNDVTITNYDGTGAPQVTAGSTFDNNGTQWVNDALATPTGYAGIASSTTFYLYYDESGNVFIFASTAPTWSDAKQGYYNGNDRALFSMFKDAGDTLYENKTLLPAPLVIPEIGGIGAITLAASSAHARSTQYLAGTTVAGNTLYYSTLATDGSSLSHPGEDISTIRNNAWASYGFTGTWRLLTRVRQWDAGNPIYHVSGLFQRIS